MQLQCSSNLHPLKKYQLLRKQENQIVLPFLCIDKLTYDFMTQFFPIFFVDAT